MRLGIPYASGKAYAIRRYTLMVSRRLEGQAVPHLSQPQGDAMKVQDQHHPDMKKVADLIDHAVVCMLTTARDGHLTSRPMSPLLLDQEGALWFLTSQDALGGLPLESVNVAFSNEADARYVSLEGHAELLDDPGRKQALWTAYAKPWFPDGPESSDLRVLKFVPRTVDYWSSPSSKVVRLFAMAASAVAGKPIGLGEREHVAVPEGR